MSEKDDEEKEEINFENLISVFSLWIKRLEEQGTEWSTQDWISWGIDITDSIIDIYTYLKSMGILFNGLRELLYIPKEKIESDVEEDEKDKTIHLYS